MDTHECFPQSASRGKVGALSLKTGTLMPKLLSYDVTQVVLHARKLLSYDVTQVVLHADCLAWSHLSTQEGG